MMGRQILEICSPLDQFRCELILASSVDIRSRIVLYHIFDYLNGGALIPF
jgi:hypothetical protein